MDENLIKAIAAIIDRCANINYEWGEDLTVDNAEELAIIIINKIEQTHTIAEKK